MDGANRSELENLICCIVRFGVVADDKDPLNIQISNICSRLKLRKNQLMDIFSFHSNIFKISDSDTVVKLIIPVKICPAFCSGDVCLENNCGMFHICKFYALSDTCKVNNCKFGHSLQEVGHNRLIINQWMLNNLNIDDFRKLFRLLVNRTSAALPQICDFYNKPSGCKRSDNFCTCLHICKHYVWGTCKLSQRCDRSHDIKNISGTLQRYGIDIQRRPKEIRNTLKYMYETFDDASSERLASAAKFRSCLTLENRQGRPTGMTRPLSGRSSSSTSLHRSGQRPADRHREAKSKQVCAFYLQGKCTFGDKCNKVHEGKPRTLSTPGAGPATRNSRRPPNQRGSNDENIICLFYLRGRCLYGQNCNKKHKKKPFQWQRKDNQSAWIDFSDEDNEKIEKEFCSLKDEFFYKGAGRVNKINFNNLSKSDEQIQRLSTIDYSKDSNFADRLLTTRWLWYWESDSGWTVYGTQDKAGFRATTTSQMIEDKFSNSPDMEMEFASHHPLGRRGQSYILDFTKMIQKNQDAIFGTERRVIRRPEFADQKVLDERQEQMKQLKKASHLKKPETWDMPDGTDIFSHFQIVELDNQSQEYQDIKRHFEESNAHGSKVASIRRVENGELWRAFSESIDALTRKLKRKIEPTRLFHGTTSDLVEAIARQGFDCRLAGSRVGHLYGRGGYFGKTSSTSASYCDSGKKMIVAKVLVGDVTVGTAEMPRPPPKNPADPYGDLYDTTVDNPSDPKIFVKFDNNHTYPEYLVTFKMKPPPPPPKMKKIPLLNLKLPM